MFTGIITHTGRVQSITSTTDAGICLQIAVTTYLEQFIIGSSHAVNGVCLTLLNNSSPLGFDVSAETIKTTNISSLQVGDRVNLEPALKFGDTIDGHLVSGHVDAVGEVLALHSGEKTRTMTIGYPPYLSRYIAAKGSICIDGISLTVHRVAEDNFDVTIIPHTLQITRAGDYKQGTQVNLEIDLLARYVERLLNERTSETTIHQTFKE